MNRIWRFAGFLLPLAAWWVIARGFDVSVALPSPGAVLGATLRVLVEKSFLTTIIATTIRAISAIGIAAAVAIPLGILSARNGHVYDLVAPSVVVVRSVPFISIILIAVIWFESGVVPVFVAFLMVFPLLFQATYTGVTTVDPKLEEMTRAFHLPRLERLRHLWWPGALPTLFGGLRSGAGIAWKVVVAAEVLSVPPDGIGTRMGEARLYLETERVLAWTIALIVLAGATDLLVARLEDYTRARRRGDGNAPSSLERDGGRNDGGRNDGGRNDRRAERPEYPQLQTDIQAAEPPFRSVVFDEVSFAWNDRSTPILDRFRLDLEAGSLTAVVGPSGVGKTTILHLLAGIIPPDAGTIITDTQHPLRSAIVFQEPRLLPWRRVGENIELSRWLLPVPSVDSSQTIEQVMEAVNLSGYRDAMPAALSGGMQQRVGLARALITKPDLLVVDEPLSAVDAAHRAELSSFLRRLLRSAGVTTALASHDLDLVFETADRVVLVEERPVRIRLDLRRRNGRWEGDARKRVESALATSRYTI